MQHWCSSSSPLSVQPCAVGCIGAALDSTAPWHQAAGPASVRAHSRRIQLPAILPVHACNSVISALANLCFQLAAHVPERACHPLWPCLWPESPSRLQAPSADVQGSRAAGSQRTERAVHATDRFAIAEAMLEQAGEASPEGWQTSAPMQQQGLK